MPRKPITPREPRELFDAEGIPDFHDLTFWRYQRLVAEVMAWRSDPRAAIRMLWRAEQARWGDGTSQRFKDAIRMAISRGHSWDISPGTYETLTAMPCDVCGGDTGKAIGLDRLDPTLGYRVDNVRPCCGRCNLARGRTGVL